MSTHMQLLGKNLRSHMLPFAIGMGTVLFGGAYLFRVKDEDYLTTNNRRFAKPFIKKGLGDDHGHGDSHGH